MCDRSISRVTPGAKNIRYLYKAPRSLWNLGVLPESSYKIFEERVLGSVVVDQ